MVLLLAALLAVTLLPSTAPAEQGLAIQATPSRGTAPLTVVLRATGANGDESLAWDLGDGTAASGATASHTYTDPGVYPVSLTATAPGGGVTTASATVIADEAAPVCEMVGSDVFAGDELDPSRWDVIRRDDDLWVGGGALHVPTSPTDIYGFGVEGLPRYPDRTVNPALTPNLVVQPVPDGAWEATTTLTLRARDQYQQAGLLLYGDDDNHAKMVFEARGNGDVANRTFQFLIEQAGHPGENGSNTAPLGAAFPDTVHLRMSFDGTFLTAAYSANGTDWVDMPQRHAIPTIINPRIGFVSFADDFGAPAIDAAFHSFTLTPDTPRADDEFTSNDLASGGPCDRWRVVRPDPAGLRVADGRLQIDTSAADIYQADNTNPTNLVLARAIPAGDWTAQTFVDGSTFDQGYHNAGIIVYGDDANYVKLDYVTDGPGAGRLELRAEAYDRVLGESVGTSVSHGRWHLRLVRRGAVFEGYYSADGQEWTQLSGGGQSQVVQHNIFRAPVGVYAWGGTAITRQRTAWFDYFHLNGS